MSSSRHLVDLRCSPKEKDFPHPSQLEQYLLVLLRLSQAKILHPGEYQDVRGLLTKCYKLDGQKIGELKKHWLSQTCLKTSVSSRPVKKQTIAINNAEKGTKTKIQARNSKSKKFIGTVGPYSRQENSSKFVYIPARQCRSHFNLTEKFKFLISRKFEIFTKTSHSKLVGTPCRSRRNSSELLDPSLDKILRFDFQ